MARSIKAAQVPPNHACREPDSRGPSHNEATLRAKAAPSAEADREKLPTEDEFLRLDDMERFVQDAEEAALNADDNAEAQEDEDEDEEEQGSNVICSADLPTCQPTKPGSSCILSLIRVKKSICFAV